MCIHILWIPFLVPATQVLFTVLLLCKLDLLPCVTPYATLIATDTVCLTDNVCLADIVCIADIVCLADTVCLAILCRMDFEAIVESACFTTLITLCILLNTAFMASEHYGESEVKAACCLITDSLPTVAND